MKNEVIKKVNKLIRKYGTNNPFEICENLGIWYYFLPLGKVKAHYIYSKRKKVFFINENLSELEKYFCAAHELGHALMHTKTNVYFNNSNTFFNSKKHEIEADFFAANLLIPTTILEEFEGFNLETISNVTGIDIKYLKLKFK